MFVFDDDLKTRGIAAELQKSGHPFGVYHDLTTEFKESGKTKPIDLYRYVASQVDELQNKILQGLIPSPKVFVFDNFTRMEYGIRSYSESIMSNISDLSPGQQKAMSQMTWPFTYDEYARFLGELLKLAPMVFLTTHTKEKYNMPGVLEARGQRPIIEKSVFRIWLRHSPKGPAPIGLVLKRIARMMYKDGKMVPVNVLPRKVDPCTWDKIYEYLDNPIGDRAPTKDEVPNPFELSILDGTLTDDQKNAIKLAAANARSVEEEMGDLATGSLSIPDKAAENEADVQMTAKVREMKASGKTLPEIVKEFGGALTPVQVAGMLKGM